MKHFGEQVETFGSMDLKEKVEFLLEQMRLTLARKDFVRTSIIAKKIATRFFDKEDEVRVLLPSAPGPFCPRSACYQWGIVRPTIK